MYRILPFFDCVLTYMVMHSTYTGIYGSIFVSLVRVKFRYLVRDRNNGWSYIFQVRGAGTQVIVFATDQTTTIP